MKKTLLFCYTLMNSFCIADDNDQYKSSFTLSSGYLDSQYTNNQCVQFGLDLLDGGNKIEKVLKDKCNSLSSQTINKLLSRGLTLLLARGFSTAYHELGHGLRLRAYEEEFHMGNSDSDKQGTFKKKENFFIYFLRSVVSFKRAFCATMGTTAELYKKDMEKNIWKDNAPDYIKKYDLYYAAGGLNNQMYYSERISDNLYFRKSGNFNEGLMYIYNKLSACSYAISSGNNLSDDPYAIENYYNQNNISAKKSHMVLGGILSLFLSGSTYSYVKLVASKDKEAKPFMFKKLRVPETYSYITDKGISYKLSSAYEVDDKNIITFGVEHVFHGKSATEFNIGLHKTFKYAIVSFSTTFGQGANFEAQCSFPLGKRFSLNAGVANYATESLLGQRHAKKFISLKTLETVDPITKQTKMAEQVKRSSSFFISATLHY